MHPIARTMQKHLGPWPVIYEERLIGWWFGLSPEGNLYICIAAYADPRSEVPKLFGINVDLTSEARIYKTGVWSGQRCLLCAEEADIALIWENSQFQAVDQP